MPQERIRQRFGKDITTEEEASQAIKILAADYESLQDKMKKRAVWESEFYDFAHLLRLYQEAQKIKAPNSYKQNVHYLKYYVLPYFLRIAECNNLESWSDHYEEFRLWLREEARLVKYPDQRISYGSKNHCIKALNTFMRHLNQKKILQNFFTCEKFPAHLLGERSLDDVILPEEMEIIYRALKEKGHLQEAIFYRMLFFTGMRFNEGLGISIADIFQGKLEHPSLKRILQQYKINHLGYMVLNSQPAHRNRAFRNADGSIERKPLKGRKRIHERYARILPIEDPLLWQDLIQLFNLRVEELENLKWGANPSDYTLFDRIDKSSSSERLKRAYQKAQLSYRSWHCCRHSCATHLMGRTTDPNLVRIWLGHNSLQILERYL